MKILDPIAIKEIDDNKLDIPIVITSIINPLNVTIIEKSLDYDKKIFEHKDNKKDEEYFKFFNQNCNRKKKLCYS